MQYQTFNDFKDSLENMLADLSRPEKNDTLAKLQEKLTDADLQKIEKAIQNDVKQSGLAFAKQLRRFRRARTAQLISIKKQSSDNAYKDSELSPDAQAMLNLELQDLRNIYAEIKKLLPKQARIDQMRKLIHKKHHDQEMQELAIKEEQMLAQPMPIDLKIMLIIGAPIILPILASILISEKYNETPAGQRRKEKKFRQAFRKHWKRRHAAEKATKERQLAAFRKMWKQMHQK